MYILPISLTSETEKALFGSNAYDIALLQRCDFPVPSGIIVHPLELFSDILKKDSSSNFSQKILKISLPEELNREIGKRKDFCLKGEFIKGKSALWKKMLEIWLEEIHLSLSKEVPLTAYSLSAQTIFFLKGKFTLAEAYYDSYLEEVLIRSEKLAPPKLKRIDQMVIRAEKLFLLPHVYRFLVDSKKAYLVNVAPFTQPLNYLNQPSLPLEAGSTHKSKKEKVTGEKSALKIFFNLSSGYAVGEAMSGVLIEGEKVLNFDEAVFKLTESSLRLPEGKVIFKLPDIVDSEVGGCLRLLFQLNRLEDSLDAFIFARNKRNLLNIELALPRVRSAQELAQIKREIGARGVTRKGSLKLWMDMAVPENVINVKDYLDIGLDGVILDIDALQRLLVGYGASEQEWYKNQIKSTLEFIKPLFKILHQSKIYILIKGRLALYPEVLDCLVEEGAWGLVVDSILEVDSMPQYLRWVERRIVLKRLA